MIKTAQISAMWHRKAQSLTGVAFGALLTACAAGGDMNDPDSALFQLSFDPVVAEASVIKLITDARKTIDISLYELDNKNIANALIEAYQRRGIKIRASTDYDSESLPGYQSLILSGIPVKLGNNSAIMHNKYIIVDSKYVVTGSTNLKGDAPLWGYTPTGMYAHFNNMAIVKSPELADDFQRDFKVQMQSTNAYGSQKDVGYTNLYGAGATWPETQYTLGSQTIQAFFTPYNDIFPTYRSNLLGDVNCTASCIFPTANSTPTSTQIDSQCAMTSCTDTVCFDNTSGSATNKGRMIYRYFNYDASQYECRSGTNSYDVYRSTLNVVISQIRQAQKSITFMVFAFTDRVIMDALMQAQARGVDVKIWMDYNQYRSNYRNSGASFIQIRKTLSSVKLCRKWDGGLLHHKVLLVDDRTVILGSMNYSNAGANSNDENFILIQNAGGIVGLFKQEIGRIDQQSFYLPPVEDDGTYISNAGD